MKTGKVRQQGAAILIVTVLLLLVVTLGTLMLGKIGLAEQKVAGQDVRSKEVYSAAVGGLEYAKDYFVDHFNDDLTFSDTDCTDCTAGDGISERGDTASVSLANLSLNADDYTYALTYTLLTDLYPPDGMPVIIRIASTATAVNDSHINKTVYEEILVGSRAIISGSSSSDFNVLDAPPIVVEECVEAFTGNPNVTLPDATDIAVGSTMGSSGLSESECFQTLESNHLDQYDCATAYDADGNCSSATLVTPTQTQILSPTQTLWQSIFGDVTMDDLLELEKQKPERLWIVDDAYPKYNGQPALQNDHAWAGNATYGSPEEPVIIIMDKDRTADNCIKINGGAVIYGLLYYETTASGASTCSFNGWGNVTIHGTIAKEGNMYKLNANTQIIGDDLNFSGTGTGTGTGGTTYDCGLCLPLYSDIPGSWRDY